MKITTASEIKKAIEEKTIMLVDLGIATTCWLNNVWLEKENGNWFERYQDKRNVISSVDIIAKYTGNTIYVKA